MPRMQQVDPAFCDLSPEYQKSSDTVKLDCGAEATVATVKANLELLRAEMAESARLFDVIVTRLAKSPWTISGWRPQIVRQAETCYRG
jgi:hypothetical protein